LLLCACPFPAPQGSQVYIGGLAGALAQAGARVRIVSYPGGKGLLPAGVEHQPCRGIGLKPRVRAGPWSGKLLLNRNLRSATRDALDSDKPDIVLAHNIEALRIASPLARKRGVPAIYCAHGIMERELPSYFGAKPLRTLAQILGRRLDRSAIKQADGFHVLTRTAADFFAARGVAEDRIHLAAPGIDLDAFDSEQVCPPHGYKDVAGDPLIVYAGNLDGYQDLETLREAFILLRQTHSNARIVLASHNESGQYRNVQRVWRRTPGVHFVRVRSFGEMKALLFKADILVNPRSLPGGFPVKLLNYMAARKPIVSCRGSAEILTDEENALLVDDGDSRSFAKRLRELSNDSLRPEQLAQAARKTVEAEYAWSDQIESLLRFIRETSEPDQKRNSPAKS